MENRQQSIEKVVAKFKEKFLSLSTENKIKMIGILKSRPISDLPQDEKDAAKHALEFAEQNINTDKIK